MNENNQTFYDDEIDLREIIQTLLKGWKVILFLTFLAGLLAFGFSKIQTPVYEASATISVNQTALSLPIDPVDTLRSDAMRMAVANSLDISTTTLPVPAITANKTLFTITVQSPDPQEVAQIVNAWSETGVAYFAKQGSPATLLENGQKLFTEADQALLDYLQKNRLDEFTWGQLAWLTGIGDGQVPPLESTTLPSLTQQQRLDLAALMQARVAAEYANTELALQAAEIQNAMSLNPPVVFNQAVVPVEPVSPKTLVNTASGLVLGGMLGVFWVFAAGWWKNSIEGKKQKNIG